MHRLTVALLAAVDAAIALAVGIAATLAPLTLVWVFGLGGGADWGTLWPASVKVWQLGHVVPLHIRLTPEYLVQTGIPEEAASFVVSLAPLAFAVFTAVFAARSGVRASRADAWVTGVLTGAGVFAALAVFVALTSRTPVAAVYTWQAVLFPVLLFAVPAALAAVVTEWREAGGGTVARVRDRVEAAPRGWGQVPALVARGSAVVLSGLVGLGALAVLVSLVVRGGEVVALFESSNVDALGATMVTLAQMAYLPTLVVWGASFIAGPGFALGTGSSVSPSGTTVGVLPGIPVLGAVPESTSPWLLLLALLVVGLGAFAGWIARSRLAATVSVAPGHHEPIGARLVITGGIAVVSGSVAALVALLASGSMGPGVLSAVGPAPGPVALAVGIEAAVGAGILLLSPLPARGARAARDGGGGDAAAPPVTDISAPSDLEPESADALSTPADTPAAADADAVTAPIPIVAPTQSSATPATRTTVGDAETAPID
jgi:hypothetical protein